MRRVSLQIAAYLSLLGLAALYLSHQFRSQGPEYLERPFSEWIENDRFTISQAATAADQVGTNALPYLVRMMRDDQAPLKTQIVRLIPFTSSLRSGSFLRHEKILACFAALGPAASPAIPQLAAMLEIPDLALPVAQVLGVVGVDGLFPIRSALTNHHDFTYHEAVHKAALAWKPELAATLLNLELNSSEAAIRADALKYLTRVCSTSSALRTNLLPALKNLDAGIRLQALLDIGGADKRWLLDYAEPLIEEAMYDSSKPVRETATNLFQRVQSAREELRRKPQSIDLPDPFINLRPRARQR
jgi:hypothetical protein